jgi:TRAP-type mannitol/chloroaromatic compound transport system permease small subunit
MPGLMKTIHVIDTAGDWCGRVVPYLILRMIGIISWEVLSRCVLSAPTIWVNDATYMLYGAHFMLGCAYTLLYGGHIRTAMVWEKFSVPKKGLIDAIAYVAFFFPAMIFFFIACVDDAWHAWKLGELSE